MQSWLGWSAGGAAAGEGSAVGERRPRGVEWRDRRVGWQVLGPFAFAKGALNFLSQSLARHLVRSKLAAHSASAAIRTFAEYEQTTRGRECGHCLPFEDVWTGAAIARLTELPGLVAPHQCYRPLEGQGQRERV